MKYPVPVFTSKESLQEAADVLRARTSNDPYQQAMTEFLFQLAGMCSEAAGYQSLITGFRSRLPSDD